MTVPADFLEARKRFHAPSSFPVDVRIKTIWATNNRRTSGRLKRASSTYGPIAQRLLANIFDERTVQRGPGLPGRVRMISRCISEEFDDPASHQQLPFLVLASALPLIPAPLGARGSGQR